MQRSTAAQIPGRASMLLPGRLRAFRGVCSKVMCCSRTGTLEVSHRCLTVFIPLPHSGDRLPEYNLG